MIQNTVYDVIYDGNCNLCVTLVRFLERLDQGKRFRYVPMQDTQTLKQFEITPEDCELGMLLINESQPDQRWQGSDAAEEIGRVLPLGALFVGFYRALPGLKKAGDMIYVFIRDNRYSLFGKRLETYLPKYSICENGRCKL